MYVRYGRTDRRPSYVCSTLRSDYGLPLCQSATAAEVEAWVAEQVLEALQPAALDASLEAAAEVEEQRRQVIRALGAAGRAGAVRGRSGRPAVPRLRAGEPPGGPDPGAALGRGVAGGPARLEEEFDRFTRAQPRLLGEADRERIRRLAGEVPTLVACPDDDARGPAPDRPAADRPGGADRRPGR